MMVFLPSIFKTFFLHMHLSSVPGPDHGLLTLKMVVPVDEGSEQLLDMLFHCGIWTVDGDAD